MQRSPLCASLHPPQLPCILARSPLPTPLIPSLSRTIHRWASLSRMESRLSQRSSRRWRQRADQEGAGSAASPSRLPSAASPASPQRASAAGGDLANTFCHQRLTITNSRGLNMDAYGSIQICIQICRSTHCCGSLRVYVGMYLMYGYQPVDGTTESV